MTTMSTTPAVPAFNASLVLSETVEEALRKSSLSIAHQCIAYCAAKYGFNPDEAIQEFGEILVERPASKDKPRTTKKLPSAPKVKPPTPEIPFPFDGLRREHLCDALAWNHGLLTQCHGLPKGETAFCGACTNAMKKADTDAPKYGTIHDRLLVGIMDYKTPEGKSPVPYATVLTKLDKTQEQAIEEAAKFDVTIDPVHFLPVPPASKKRVKNKKDLDTPLTNDHAELSNVDDTESKPKKLRTTLQVSEDDVLDLFDDVIASATPEPPVRLPLRTVLKKKDFTKDQIDHFKKITLPDKSVYIRNKQMGNVVFDFNHYIQSNKEEFKPVGHWSDNLDKIVFYDDVTGLITPDEQLEELYEE